MTQVLCGDALTMLSTLSANSVHCVVTSPPYYGLRDYGVEGQLGLEATPKEYIEKLVTIFQQVKRVLREDGVIFLNLGDSFLEKQLMGIPWKVAFALQDDGWWLRSDIIWSKGNPMPESVTDRCTNSHEYVFMLTKAARYFFDHEAIKENSSELSLSRAKYNGSASSPNPKNIAAAEQGIVCGPKSMEKAYGQGRNKRSVWSINSQPYSGAHFATMPPKLAEICILAGTSEAGCCSQCGKAWVRVVEVIGKIPAGKRHGNCASIIKERNDNTPEPFFKKDTKTIGFRPACTCNAPSIPCTVLDPFGGSGTTGEVAQRLGRDAILIELNPNYLPMIDQRTRQSGLALCA